MATDNTYYIDTSLFSTATAVWSDSALTTKAPDGWYQAPTETTVTYRQQTGGVLGTAANCECPVACGSNISGSGNVGSYVIDIDMGNTTTDVGAIVVYFQPYNIPDGILATFDSTTYNTLTTNNHGIELATAGEINFVGKPTGGCTASDLEGSSNTVSNYTYNGTTFVDTGTDTTIVIPSSGTVNLNATGNIYYTMVIPKPNVTPSNLRLQMVGVCGGTAFQFLAICPVALPSFTTNTVQTNSGLACSATQDQTYYFARNSSTIGQATPVADSNTIPQVGNFVFSDSNGVTALADGFYKLDATTVAQVVSGVVSAITTCPTNTAFASSTTGASVIAACTDTIDQTFYHNGSGTLPTSGDNAYSDAGGTTPLSAGFYKLNVTSYIEITGSAGLVSGPSSFVLGTSFSSSTSQTSGTDACAASLTTTFYHNGSGTLPVASDTCYTDACKTITLSDGLYKITTTNGGSYITITGGSGVVASVTNCSTCTSYPSSNPLSFGAICNPGATPSIDNTYYHNGSGTYPVTGDTVYTIPGCSNPLNGGNSYFYIYSVGTNNFYIRVDSNGLVILDSSCTPP